MMRVRLEPFVKERFGMSLLEFIQQKVGREALHDYEIAEILRVSVALVRKLRNHYGIKKANGFHRHFERTYGEGAVKKFKELIENPDHSLTDVARYFEFSREYARQVYQKIYGSPYTEAHKRKRLTKKKQRLASRRKKSKQMATLLQITDKMRSMGFNPNVSNTGPLYMILENGYKLALRTTSTPIMIGKKKYYRITNAKAASVDFDFFICLCKNEMEDTHFIIPSYAMPRSVVSLLPNASPAQSKYAEFREAWHLLAHQKPKEVLQSC